MFTQSLSRTSTADVGRQTNPSDGSSCCVIRFEGNVHNVKNLADRLQLRAQSAVGAFGLAWKNERVHVCTRMLADQGVVVCAISNAWHGMLHQAFYAILCKLHSELQRLGVAGGKEQPDHLGCRRDLGRSAAAVLVPNRFAPSMHTNSKRIATLLWWGNSSLGMLGRQMHTYTHTYVHTYIYIYVQFYRYVCIYIYTYIYMHIHVLNMMAHV